LLQENHDFAPQEELEINFHPSVNPYLELITSTSSERVQNSRLLAQAVQQRKIQALGLTDRGVRTANFHVLRETNMAAILSEIGFLTNPGDRAVIMSEQGRDQAAQAIHLGILDYLTQQQSATATITGNGVNFRRGPGTNYGVISVLPLGTNVTFLGTNANGSWTNVRHGSNTGWVSSEFINVPPGTSPPSNDQTIVAPSTSRRRHGMTVARAHLRRGPGTTHDTIRILSPYTEVLVTGRSANDRWSHVHIGDEVGWISRDHLRELTTFAQTHRRAHLRTGAGTQYSTIRILNANTHMTILGSSIPGAWRRVRVGGDLGWVHYSHIENREIAVNTFARGHLRRGQRSDTTSMNILNANTRIHILGHSGDGRWVRARAGNQTGWIYAGHVREPGRTTAAVNLRRGAGTNHGVIRVLPNNTNVRVLRRSSGGTWTQVVAGNDTGWISSEFFRN